MRDRRLKQPALAVSAYEKFLEKYGFDNVWADEAVWGLITLSMNDLKQPDKTLKWTATFQEKFPKSYRMPQAALFHARALWRLGKQEEAKKALAEAETKYNSSWILMYNEEDDFIERISFSLGAEALRGYFARMKSAGTDSPLEKSP